PGLDLQRVHRLQRLEFALRHRERVVAEVDLLRVLVVLVHREVDDPAEPELAITDQAELLAHPGARGTCELGGLQFLAGGEEAAVIGAEADSVIERLHPLLPMVLGDRAAELAALAGDIAEPGMAFRTRPVVHVVEELAALLRRGRSRDRADLASAAYDLL